MNSFDNNPPTTGDSGRESGQDARGAWSRTVVARPAERQLSSPEQRRMVAALALLTWVVFNMVLVRWGLRGDLLTNSTFILAGMSEVYLLALWFALGDRSASSRLLLTTLVALAWSAILWFRVEASLENRAFLIAALWAQLFVAAAVLGVLRLTRGWTIVPLEKTSVGPPTRGPVRTTLSSLMMVCFSVALITAAAAQFLRFAPLSFGSWSMLLLLAPAAIVTWIGTFLMVALLSANFRPHAALIALAPFLIVFALTFMLVPILGPDALALFYAIPTLLLPLLVLFLAAAMLRSMDYRLTRWGAVDPKLLSEQARNTYRVTVPDDQPPAAGG